MFWKHKIEIIYFLLTLLISILYSKKDKNKIFNPIKNNK